MAGYIVFASDRPVTLRWTAPDGAGLSQRARLQDVSDSRLIVEVPWREQYNPPAIGGHATAETADAKGQCLALFRGTVKSIASRQLDIRLDRSMDVVQRRAHPRARVPFGFHTAVLLSAESSRYFLAHPLDVGAGGVRMLHRLPLRPGDRFRLTFRPRPGIMIAPSAQVIESQPVNGAARGPPGTAYVTRARFVDLPDSYQRFFTRYVGWLLSNRN
jgi:hypothetical protein